MSKYGGEGNIGHRIEEIKIDKKNKCIFNWYDMLDIWLSNNIEFLITPYPRT